MANALLPMDCLTTYACRLVARRQKDFTCTVRRLRWQVSTACSWASTPFLAIYLSVSHSRSEVKFVYSCLSNPHHADVLSAPVKQDKRFCCWSKKKRDRRYFDLLVYLKWASQDTSLIRQIIKRIIARWYERKNCWSRKCKCPYHFLR